MEIIDALFKIAKIIIRVILNKQSHLSTASPSIGGQTGLDKVKGGAIIMSSPSTVYTLK